MKKFERGIQKRAFIDALNVLYHNNNSFWYKMVNDKELFIAIRKEYLNVYYHGQSICKLSYDKSVIGKTHKKYLGVNVGGYFSSSNGVISDKASKIMSLAEISLIKENVKKYIGKEKDKSYNEILNFNNNILDVEATLVKCRIPNPKLKRDYEVSSIDYVALEHNENNVYKLVFYEAKHFSNPEIRSRKIPRVFSQINRYKEALALHKTEILDSYKLVLNNLNDLSILKTRNIIFSQAIKEKMEIDFEPRLIVFGVDKDENKDEHLIKLRNHFNNNLILNSK